MKKVQFTTLLLLYCTTLMAQIPDSVLTKTEFHSQISKVSDQIKKLERNNYELQQAILVQKKQIDSITLQLSVVQSYIQQIADSLHITVTNVSSTNKQTQNQIHNINKTITNRTLYWIIGILVFAFLCVIAFIILRNKLSLSTKNLDSQIAKTNETMQNEAIKLDSKLIEILQTQLSILKEERTTKETIKTIIDHKLPLKVGNEIYRMRQRIISMNSDNKALLPLSKSLERLEEEFNESGYEIKDLLNKSYNDGLSVKATFVPSTELKPGEQKITRVIKPQINYNDQAIQMAEIEVSTGN